jgi:methylmalonyl-CoA mutase N-terminal domain/subunit
VNVHRSEAAADEELVQQELSRDAEEKKKAELARLRASRDGAAVRTVLHRLRDEARGTGNLMPAIREAVLAYATVGEIAQALKDVFGTYVPPTRF